MNSVQKVKDKEDFTAKLHQAKKSLVVLYFWASWADECSQMSEVLEEIAKQYQNVVCLTIEAEELPEITESFDIEAVPTFIFLKNKQKIDRLDGAHAPELNRLVKQHVDTVAPPTPVTTDPKEVLNNRLKSLICSAPCVLFMKGSPTEPKCGFSRQIVSILNEQDCKYSTFDILQDQEVRQGLKEYSNWPTYPQLYVKGELLGGLDIVRDMAAEGELKEMLPQSKNKGINDRIKMILEQNPVILFMKGEPAAPRCGFSRQIVEILNKTGISYSHFDILTDDDIRQGLKKYSDWPTYPQLYAKGELLGGLDIIRDMELSELTEVLQNSGENAS